MNIAEIVAAQRSYFGKGETLDLFFRRAALKKLRSAILAREAEINAALKADLNKSSSESYMCEIGMTLSELNYVLAHMGRWAKKHRVLSPLAQFHARSFTVHNPYGVVLIMSPWNYPFMLTLEPLIGAIAAGNCCVVKPSAYAPATSSVIRALIADCFPPEYVAVVEGGRRENQALLDQRFDYIFFTGGVSVGREVMRRASEHLTPVSLELGGKSPCIVDSTAKLDLAAKRIAFGKLLNCGQTCVAPDYLLIDRKVKDAFLGHLKKHIVSMIGGDALENDQYVRMVSRRHYDRVMGLIDPEKVVFGGRGNPDALQIQPTIMDGVTAQDAVMQEEIFGPVLPVIAYDSIDEAVEFIGSREHPLALYLFSEDRQVQERFLRSVSFGGGCLNDTIIHLATSRMGFGGVGGSGMGAYHGKKSFETFSHEKSVVSKSTWMDLPVRYMPYSDVKDRLLRLFLR
ncbi:MAG: aldehyde dehydrogenase [Clostridia bacterium]|nr:aldehyde dehydrogenase [Clostridia bacterium]